MTAEEKLVKRVEDLEGELTALHFAIGDAADVLAGSTGLTEGDQIKIDAASEILDALGTDNAIHLTARDEVIKALVEVAKEAKCSWTQDSHDQYGEKRHTSVVRIAKATAALAMAKKLEEG